MTLTRAEAYARSRGKEEPAILAAIDLLEQTRIGKIERVIDPALNRTVGDLLLPDGRYVEVKHQAIDPFAYGGLNFIEVCERNVGEDRHWRGMSSLARWLLLTTEALSMVPVKLRDGTIEPFGMHPALCIPEQLWRADMTLYVNAESDPQWCFVEHRDELARAIRAAATAQMVLNAGASHEDTYGCFIRKPDIHRIWARQSGGKWASLAITGEPR